MSHDPVEPLVPKVYGREEGPRCQESQKERKVNAMTDQEREDWNVAWRVCQNHFPNLPILDDDHPLMPKETVEFQKKVIAAIVEGRQLLRDEFSVA